MVPVRTKADYSARNPHAFSRPSDKACAIDQPVSQGEGRLWVQLVGESAFAVFPDVNGTTIGFG